MTTDPQTADIEYRLARLEENIRALTGMVESLVAIRHVGAYVPPTKPHVRGVEPTWAILDEAAELERFGPFGGDADELEPWTSAAASTRDEIERTASDSGLLSRTGNDGALLGEVVHDEAAELVPSTAETAALTVADLDAMSGGTTVYDADGDGWVKTGTRWRLDNEGRSERAATLIKVYGPLTAEHAAEQPTQDSKTVLTVNELLALPDGAVVQDSDWELWEKTRLGWFMHGTAADAPTARTLSSKTLFECRGPLTVRAATN